MTEQPGAWRTGDTVWVREPDGSVRRMGVIDGERVTIPRTDELMWHKGGDAWCVQTAGLALCELEGVNEVKVTSGQRVWFAPLRAFFDSALSFPVNEGYGDQRGLRLEAFEEGF